MRFNQIFASHFNVSKFEIIRQKVKTFYFSCKNLTQKKETTLLVFKDKYLCKSRLYLCTTVYKLFN